MLLGLVSAILPFSLVAADSSNASKPPNVLLIMTDDQGWGDLHCHANDSINTPVLDQLSHESVRLQRFFVSPVCAPTRAALLTGRYPGRCGVAGVSERLEVMRGDEETMAEVFANAGYRTGCFGKWHNGAQYPNHPLGQGFEEFYGFCGGHWNLYDDPILEFNGKAIETKGYITDLITDAALSFIDEAGERPFLCYVPYNAPHGPFQISQQWFSKYSDGILSAKTAAVYAMVENIDANIGRLLSKLQQRQLSDDTIVVFLTDNGPNGPRYNGGMRGAKGSVHEGGVRVPCFIRWPGQLQAKDCQQIAAHIDLLPTLAELAGIDWKPAHPLDGRSLVRLLKDGSDESFADRVLITSRPDKANLDQLGRAAARDQRFRLTIEKGKTQLFDMQTDPGQATDISKQHPEIVDRLSAAIDRHHRQVQPIITAPRPIPVGYEEVPSVFLPAVEAHSSGEIGFANGNGWAHDWLSNWTRPTDSVSFDVQFHQPGNYEIIVHANASVAGTQVTASIDDRSTTGALALTSHQRVVRPDLDTDSQPRLMMEFDRKSLGTIEVADTSQVKTLKLTADAESTFHLDLGGVTLVRTESESAKPMHLFVLAGQSNMAGRGKMGDEDRQPFPNVMMLNKAGQWVPAIAPVHFDKSVAGVGLGRTFAIQYAKANPDVTVGLIPCAVGGSPISAWQPGGYHSSTKTHPYDDAAKRIELAKQSGAVKGILWHQGESDSNDDAAKIYKPKLQDTLERLRTLSGGDVPILIGGLGQFAERPWNEARKKIDAAHRELAQEMPHTGYVPSDGLTANSDLVHFNTASLKEFGRRYFSAFQSLTQ
ncbi:Arylsulfatase precursor [Stieleria varia]|uniref:Arylsulfatase n=2 Tax=Stieleria varia TaxID=2528005 RepID=A0A5C5ZT93_9BACT|nr:Arylsulfatase precursor [Stieleria varia]